MYLYLNNKSPDPRIILFNKYRAIAFALVVPLILLQFSRIKIKNK